jgi:hypothetical protein
MTQEMDETVRALKNENSLKTHPFHLVRVNYYCKHGSGRYLGCEIALAEFSFVDGVRKTYHTFINPGEIPVGYVFLATKRTTETRIIVFPPDGFGSEPDHLEILNNFRLFLMGEDGDETKLPSCIRNQEISTRSRAFCGNCMSALVPTRMQEETCSAYTLPANSFTSSGMQAWVFQVQ